MRHVANRADTTTNLGGAGKTTATMDNTRGHAVHKDVVDPDDKEHKDMPDSDEEYMSMSNQEIVDSITPQQRRRLLRKLDWRIIPIVGLIYCISLLDRTNLAQASIAGMNEELRLDKGARYSIITLSFFITYILFQPPATILIRKIGARMFLTIICIVWGIFMMCFGFAQNWYTLVAFRLILGILEAGCFPGVIYLMSTWYTRYDLGIRYGWWYTAGAFASAFGSILAFGFMQMDGIANYRGWRWIFIFEGIITVLIGIAGGFFLVSFPDDRKHKVAGFINEKERQWVIASIEADRGDAITEAFSWPKYLRAALDWKIWCYGFILGATTTIGYALAYFLPIILYEGMGFELGVAQILVAPPYVFCAALMVVTTWLSDKFRQRGLFIALMAAISIVGLALIGYVDILGVRYFGVFLAVSGAVINIPLVSTWQANNIRGQWKRAFCSATLVGSGGIGGIIGSTVFREQDRPGYLPGINTTIGAGVFIILIVLVLEVDFIIQNKRADKGQIKLEQGEGKETDFRYTY